jgi:anti-anti-sigma factor
MAADRFDARVRHEPGVAVIELQGEVNGFAAEGLQAAYDEAVREQPSNILLNFAGVTYINSTGIALIVGLMAKARAVNHRVLACDLSDHYEEIFTITRLSDFMSIFPDEASAISGAAAS